MRASDLLLALDEELEVERQAPGLLHVRLDRLDVHEDLALVVRRAARVDLAVAHRRLERRRRPEIQRIDRLHVVVAVEEDRRLPRCVEPVAVDHRMAGRVDQLHVAHPGAGERVGRPLRRAPHVGGMLGKRADARDRQILPQFINVSIAVDIDEVDDVVHAVIITTKATKRA